MKKLAALLLIALYSLCMGIADSQTIDIKRLGASACQCQTDTGVAISPHTSDIEAIEACVDRAFVDGLKKRLVCSYELSVTKPATTPPTTYTLPLNWTMPTMRTDGSALAASELVGYRIYYGTSPTAMTLTMTVAGGGTLSAQIPGLVAGTYYVSVTARTATEESALTNVLVSTVG